MVRKIRLSKSLDIKIRETKDFELDDFVYLTCPQLSFT